MRNKVFITVGLLITTYYVGAKYEKQIVEKCPKLSTVYSKIKGVK